MTKETMELVKTKEREYELIFELINILCKFNEEEPFCYLSLFECDEGKFYAQELIDFLLKKYY